MASIRPAPGSRVGTRRAPAGLAWLDLVLGGFVLSMGVVELALAGRLPAGGVLVQAVYLVGIVVAVLLRGTRPEWSAGSYLLATVFVCLVSQPYELLAVGVAFTVLPFLFASALDGARMWTVLAVLQVAVAIRSLDDPQQDWFAALLDQGWVLQSALAGLVVRRYRHRADQLGSAAAERARDAVELERARISRELHDVVGHQVTALIVTADAARGALEDALAGRAGTDLTSAGQATLASLATIEATGRECLAEMRHLVGLLRDSDPASLRGAALRAGPDAQGIESGFPLAPPTGLDRLDELLRAVRAAGLPVRVESSGTPGTLSRGASLAVYRVVQESLTNTLRHAGPAQSTIRLTWQTDHLEVQVDDNGAARSPAPAAGGCSGLAGLGERVRIFGGTFTAGPVEPPGRGWTVRAVLPREPGGVG